MSTRRGDISFESNTLSQKFSKTGAGEVDLVSTIGEKQNTFALRNPVPILRKRNVKVNMNKMLKF